MLTELCSVKIQWPLPLLVNDDMLVYWCDAVPGIIEAVTLYHHPI